jgi:PAS domain S-box-containing protein
MREKARASTDTWEASDLSSANEALPGSNKGRYLPGIEVEMEETVDEVRHLKACINNLISLLALPAIWTGGEEDQILTALLDALLGMLRLDFVYVELKGMNGGAPIEMIRPTQSGSSACRVIKEALKDSSKSETRTWPLVVQKSGEGDISIAVFRLGLNEETGVFVAGSRRTDFPDANEKLLLNVAATQATIGLQEAQLLREQRRLAGELDQKVAQRTEALQRSEFYLSEGERLNHIGSWAFDRSGFFDYWSPELFRIYGLDPAQGPPTLAEYLATIHPEDRECMAGTIQKMLAEASGCDVKKRIVRPDGPLRYIRCVGAPVFDKDVFKGFVGTAMDVTELQ